MSYVSHLDYPSNQLLKGIMERVNALGLEPRVVVELDKMTYVPGFRRKYDAIQYVMDSAVGDLLSIDKAEKLTDYVNGTYIDIPTELRNANMSMPILTSSTMRGKENGERTINGMYITDWFDTDVRSSRYIGRGGRHKGIDLDLAMGDPLHAVWGGTVAFAGTAKGYGKVVYINHGNGWQTRYAHMDTISVSRGQTVQAGQLIGAGGNSGRSVSSGGGDGSHLHFEVRHNDVPLNPEPFLRGKKTIQIPSKSAASTTTPAPTGGFAEYNMEATAYVADCPGCIGITRGGTDVRAWKDWKIIAVDPSIIPLKSKVELIVDGASWGEYLADDTGGDIKGSRIDILMETKAKALQFGRRPVVLRVKSWGDGKARTQSNELSREIVTYQVNKTSSRQIYHKDFSTKKTALDKKIYKEQTGVEQFFVKDDGTQYNVLGFKGTAGAGDTKKFVFEYDWVKAGNLAWAYYTDLEKDDVVTVKVDDYIYAQIKGINAKNGIAYPPSIPIPKGKHKVEISLANPSKASIGKFGVLWFRAKVFDVETLERKQLWDFEDPMKNTNNWKPYGTVKQKDKGDYQAISTGGGEAGIERVGKVKKFPFTLNFTVKVSAGTTGKVVISNGKKVFLVYIKPDSIYTMGGGAFAVNNKDDFVEYTVVCHDETDIDVYYKVKSANGTETWKNTGIRGAATDYTMDRLLFSVTEGTMYLSDIRYAANDYAIEQFSSHIGESYDEKWYEVGDFVFEEMFTIDRDVIQWEINSHLEMSSSTAKVVLDNSSGLYSPTWERKPEFPESYSMDKPPMTYYENGQLCHVVSEGTPVRIYAGYGEHLVRVFTGMIKGEIQEDSEQRTITFSCVDRYDMLDEFVFFKSMSYPPEEAYAGDGGAFTWIKSSIVEDIVVESGMTAWKVHAEDFSNPDYVIEDTVYIDVNKGKNTFMKFNKETGELEAVSENNIMTVGGWQNPFVASVTYPVGTRASDAVNSLIEDIPYRTYCDRYGTFRMDRLDFLDSPDWAVVAGTKWEFVDNDNLLSITSSTDHSKVRNHLMITGTSGLTEHFFDKSLLTATKGQIRTAGNTLDWVEEKDGDSMRGLKEQVANKIFFDMKRQARTKNVVVKGNPLIEILDAVYVYDEKTYTADYYLVKGNRLVGNSQGILNYMELTWQTLSSAG